MYYLSTSCLVFFFIFSFCASSELEFCETQFQCGNFSAGFPFWGENRPKNCGHPWMELHCIENITSLFISYQEFYVSNFDETSNTLTLARPDHLGSFCSSAFKTTTLTPELYELSQTYTSLTVFYHCHPQPYHLPSYKCAEKGLISVSEKPEHHETCHANVTVNVPKSFDPEAKELNMTHLESVLSKGFEVKLKIDPKACQDCVSSHELCGFNETSQSGVKCIPINPPTADELHRRCSASFECGDQRELFYPFWRDGREDCGHPEFKLECNATSAELSISSVKYRILEANYTSAVIRFARSDFINNPCPSSPLNAPFIENVLPLVQNTELLTIYYDCRPDFLPPLPTFFGDLDCGDDDGGDDRRNYYATGNLTSRLLGGNLAILTDLSRFCDRNVSIPASGPALNILQSTSSIDNLKKALEYGFQLGLNQDCLTCVESGGACGYNRTTNGFACYCMDGIHTLPTCSSRPKRISFGAGAKIGSAVGALLLLVLALTLFLHILRKRITSNDQQSFNALIPLKQYSYAQVKRITKSFTDIVGKGGFGIVYRGILCDGRMVAVKVLKDSKCNNGEDFINEVASMSQASHVNIVTLLRFCFEGSKKAIIYEFLENGSLDKFISSMTSTNTDWTALYRIALGIARGLEYLHHGCRTRIVHFDIKPQNVLLDDNLCPKVADFGLAKLCEKKESILSLLDTRGTIGYIAPEVFSRMFGRVSHKSDVYSYGMLVLEMIGARNKTRADQNSASNTSSMYFPEWIYKDLEQGDNGRPDGNIITCDEKEKIGKKMTLVGLWCIQTSPSDRPLMNRVVEMMEGSLDDLEVPPRPVFQIPAASIQDSSTLSEDISVYTEVDIGVHSAN